MKICVQCGTEIFEDEKFCYSCGYFGEYMEYEHTVDKKQRNIAIVLALIPGIFDIFGLGQLCMKRYLMAFLFFSISMILLTVALLYDDIWTEIWFILVEAIVLFASLVDVLITIKRM